VLVLIDRHVTGGGTDARLEVVARHAGASADRPFGDRSALGRLERSNDVVGRRVEPEDVVQRSRRPAERNAEVARTGVGGVRATTAQRGTPGIAEDASPT